MVEKNESSIRSIQRDLSILKCFDTENQELSFSNIASTVDLPKSTVSRILSTLENEGFLVRDQDTAKYKLGHTIYLLGVVANSTMDIRNIGMPHLEKMTKLTEETANLYILEDFERVCIAQVSSPNPIKHLVKIGERLPICAGATGRSILAFLGESMWLEMIKDIKQFTQKTVVDRELFIEELKNIRKKGYSLSLGEKFSDVGCVAAPVFNDSGVIGCISISGPVDRFPEDISDYARLVTTSATQISHKLGYRQKRTAFLE